MGSFKSSEASESIKPDDAAEVRASLVRCGVELDSEPQSHKDATRQE